MNTRTAPLAIAPLVLVLALVSGTAQAALQGRDLNGSIGSFEAYYDTDLKITWLADANYAQTSGYATQNMMNWSDAMTWAANLVYSRYIDWRLPTALNQDGTGPCGPYDCTSSEMGHLFHNKLGGTANSSIYNSGDADLALFPNIQLGTYYWSSTEYAPLPDAAAWGFWFGGGIQAAWDKTYLMHTWAVHDGDVGVVPEAESWAMLLAGLGLVGAATRRRRG